MPSSSSSGKEHFLQRTYNLPKPPKLVIEELDLTLGGYTPHTENMTLIRVCGADIGLGGSRAGSRGLDSTPLPERGQMLEIHLSPRINYTSIH